MAKEERRAEKDLRKHLKRLESELAAASKAETKRLRKLEKARWRRQRIQAFIDEARAIAEIGTGAPQKTVGPAAGPAAAPEPEPAPVSRRRAWRSAKETPAASPEKPAT